MTMLNDVARRLPAEWEPQDAVMIAWPHSATDWAPMLDEVTGCYIALARAIIESAPLIVVTPDVEAVRTLLAGIATEDHPVIFREIPTNDTWARDFGPVTIESQGRMIPLDFTFNGWGMKFAADLDNLITVRMAHTGIFASAIECRRSIVLEGGSIESDGKGTIMTTSECLLSPNRNPWLSREEIEAELLEAFGAGRMLWLDHGYLEGDDTDSHVDTLARFAPDDTIIYVAPPDDHTDPHFESLAAMERQLKSLTTADGLPYNLIALPMADVAFDECGCRLPATYANFLITNGAVLVPSYGSPQKDTLAARMIGVAFPDREIRQVDCRALIRQHGSLHCVTMQLPAGTLAPNPA